MGAATAMYSATCHIFGKYGNGNPYPINLSSVVGLNSWLPCSRTLSNQIQQSNEAVRCAALLPILLCHDFGDDVVPHKHGENSALILRSSRFKKLTPRSYVGLGYYTSPEEMDGVCRWLSATLGFEGS